MATVAAMVFIRRSALVVFVDFGELGVDDFLVALRTRRGTFGWLLGRGGLLLLVDRLAHLHREVGQRRALGLDRLDVVALERGLGFGERRLDLALERSVDLVTVLLELLLGRVDQAVGVVLRLGRLAALLVLVGELLGVLDHLVDIGVGQAARSLDADLLFLAGALVLGAD